MQRPTPVTVAAWIIIVMAADAIVGSFSSLVRPILNQLADPHVGVPLTALFGSLIQIAVIVSAVCMLRGASWARITYAMLAGFVVFGLLVSWFRVSGMGPIAVYTIAKTAVLLYVLFGPAANEYFASRTGSGNADGLSSLGRTDV